MESNFFDVTREFFTSDFAKNNIILFIGIFIIGIAIGAILMRLYFINISYKIKINELELCKKEKSVLIDTLKNKMEAYDKLLEIFNRNEAKLTSYYVNKEEPDDPALAKYINSK